MSCTFPPEPNVSGRTCFDVAGELAARGHDVTVVAPFPNRPGGTLHAGYRRAVLRRQAAPEGFNVVRCGSFFSRRSSMLSRLLENLSFGATSSLALVDGRKPDVIYANSWPIFASAAVALVARLRRVPLVVCVQDLYPESLVSQGRGGGGVLGRLLLAIDRRIARGAAAVVAISERLAEHYRRTRDVDRSRIHVVPNWLRSDATEEQSGVAGACRDRHDIPRDAFLVTYGGTVGVAASVETVIEAFRELDDRPDVHLLVAGEGTSLEHCRRLAAAIAARRIHFETPWNGTMAVLHAADVVVLPTRGQQSAVSVPSKLISYLLSARPVVAVALPSSDIAAMVLGSRAGLVVEPDDPRALVAALRTMTRLSPEARRRMGRAGRAWAVANVTAEVCLPRLARILESEARER